MVKVKMPVPTLSHSNNLCYFTWLHFIAIPSTLLFSQSTSLIVASQQTKLIMKSAKRSTSCYHPEVSRLHCIPCAETWNFYLVEPITILELNESDVQVKSTCLGPDLIGGNQWQQHTVLPNVRFGAFPTEDYISADGAVAKATAERYSESHYSAVGCTSAPTFQFQDFELASGSELVSSFSKYESAISFLTLPD